MDGSEIMKSENWGCDVHLKVEDRITGFQRAVRQA
jgi:hypothetical protein